MRKSSAGSLQWTIRYNKPPFYAKEKKAQDSGSYTLHNFKNGIIFFVSFEPVSILFFFKLISPLGCRGSQ
jgi:hypothetical protein